MSDETGRNYSVCLVGADDGRGHVLGFPTLWDLAQFVNRAEEGLRLARRGDLGEPPYILAADSRHLSIENGEDGESHFALLKERKTTLRRLMDAMKADAAVPAPPQAPQDAPGSEGWVQV